MKLIRISFLLALLAGALLLVPGAPASSKAMYYVSLGDSLAQGYQPIGGPASRESPPGYNQGYADQLFKLVRGDDQQLREVKLGCGGETTVTFRFGGLCTYEQGSQLAEAVAFLQAHAGEIAFVTIDIGANDILSGGGPPAIAANLPPALAALKAAAGPGVPVVGMNYYDPFVAPVWFQTQSLVALQAEVAQTVGFNNFLEAIYGAFGVTVADVESAFSVTDLTLVGGTPVNVLRACAWTWACAGPPVGFDIHANNEGYGAIADVFAEILDG
jgi:lysophospholipase L1-like esterase